MKHTWFSIVILLAISCNTTKLKRTTSVIKFSHTGITNRMTIPLYISTKKLDIKLNKNELQDLQHILGDSVKITKQDEEKYFRLKLDNVVTDGATFSIVYDFIFNNPKYFTDDSNKIDDQTWESYDVYTDGKRLSINYKLKSDFFADLESLLRKKNADERVIAALGYL